ncbi:MAG: HipA domain-containing protein [Bryobacterales bacterium]|nr:HipA domain-containing protein [Bryobacterales bacterium]
MHAPWRWIAFNILTLNSDDHLRNHGFLYAGAAGWRIAPGYGNNPAPADIKPRTAAQQPGSPDAGEVRQDLFRAHQQDGLRAGQIAKDCYAYAPVWPGVRDRLERPRRPSPSAWTGNQVARAYFFTVGGLSCSSNWNASLAIRLPKCGPKKDMLPS